MKVSRYLLKSYVGSAKCRPVETFRVILHPYKDKECSNTRNFFLSICNWNPSTSNFILFGVVEMLQKLSLWAKGWHFWRAIITRSKFWINHNYTITLSMLYIITRPLTNKTYSREHSCGLWGRTAVVSIWLARNILQVDIGLQFGSHYISIWTKPCCLLPINKIYSVFCLKVSQLHEVGIR